MDSLAAQNMTPRALSFSSPAPTNPQGSPLPDTNVSVPEKSPVFPDNQLGLDATPVNDAPEKTKPDTPMSVLKQAEPSQEKNQGPGSKAASSNDALPDEPAPGPGEGKHVILEGTMYEDGTYWKIFWCIFMIPYVHFFVIQSLSGYPRMDRYMKQVKKGKVAASPELVKLWGSTNGRSMA